MGYTNYWKQDKDFTDSEWKAVKKEYVYLLEVAGDIIDDGSISDNEIFFDGNTANPERTALGHRASCETFVLSKKRRKPEYKGEDTSFNFCKTRELPYDLPIWHLLTFAYHNTNAITDISRDR